MVEYSNLVMFEAPLNQNCSQLLGAQPPRPQLPEILYWLSPPHLNYLLCYCLPET